jgi:acetolactate decarboxylase
MPRLDCEISQSLWDAVARQSRESGEPVSHIVMRALADAVQLDHGTLFQVSTSGALVEGIYDGVVSVAALKHHGDFGLGTFADLDGEMVALDGRFFHARADGSFVEAPDRALVPFAVVTRFRAEREADIGACESLAELVSRLDGLRDTSNLFFAIRVDGVFDQVRMRVACKAAPDTPLVKATERQAEFALRGVEGTLVGFWTPRYARAINVAGYHLHFIAAHRRTGGHLLDCSARSLRVSIQHEADFRIAIPETAHFLKADLTRDGSQDLETAETRGHALPPR